MFKLSANPTYTAPVKVDMPTDNGKTIQKTFEAKFKRLTQTELDDLQKRVSSGDLGDDAFVSEVLVGWSGVQDDDGNELEFNPKNLASALDVYPVRPSIIRAFYDTIKTAKTKN